MENKYCQDSPEPGLLAGNDGLPSGRLTARGYRRSLSRFVANLNRKGIVAILDLHWSGGPGVRATGLRAMPDFRSVAFWRSVAFHYHSRRSVMFDLFSEPYSRWHGDRWIFNLGWACWASGGCRPPVASDAQQVGRKTFRAVGMNDLLKAVRRAGARQPVIFSGTDYSNNVSGMRARLPRDRQLIAGFHNYTVQRCASPSCWNAEITNLNRAMPVITTEFGQADCGTSHIRRYVNWADRNKIGYLAWAWWAIDEGCSNYALIRNWSGSPSGRYGTFYRNHLRR